VYFMPITRRRFLQTAAAGTAIPAVSHNAAGQTYPARPLHLIVGYAPGGSTDITARLIAQELSKRTGATCIVENRPGASTNIATEAVIRSPADGYMLLMATAANAINASLYENLPFDFVRDTAPVVGVIRMQNVLEVHPSLPVRTVPELIAYAKANPGSLILGTAGRGSPGQVSGSLFEMMTGIKMLHVPYRGAAPALRGLLGGQVNVMVDNMATALPYIKTGQVRALAVTTAARSHLLPDLPTIGETVPGYEASSWFGVVAPKGTPAEATGFLNREINAVLRDSAIVARFSGLGGTPLGGSPADFGKLIADETEKWGRVVRFAAKPS
jgi:tripartite-type tricarboxylate transporter receptor subunit TctC